MMKPYLEKIVYIVIIAPLAPLAGLMGFWWISYATLPEKWIPFFTIAGFLLGLLVDVFILKQVLARVDQLPMTFWMVVFIFYSVGMFGFFMGVPVINALLALPAGWIIGARLAAQKADVLQIRKMTRVTTGFTTGVLFLVCVASAFFALVSPSTSNDLRGMLHLEFDVTQGMIVGLILIGGILLLSINALLTAVSIHLTRIFLKFRT